MRPLALSRCVVAVSAALVLVACGEEETGSLGPVPSEPQPTTIVGSLEPSSTISADESQQPSRPRVVRTIASDLEVPWGITFLPDGSALVGERDSTRVLAIEDGRAREVGRLSLAKPQGEAGLLGLAASPTYATDRLVFAYVSTASDNRVVSMTYDGTRLGAPRTVLSGIPNGFVHDGGRLLFAPDGTLFVSTGETGEPDLAQDPKSLAGKVLRITADGKPAQGNPVEGSAVWTMGHRNVQGLAFDQDGRLWATEFGQDTWDELNRIDKGRNYGWPRVEGRGNLPEYRNPYVTWSTDEASPSGLAYLGGSLWAGALRGRRLWQVPVTESGVGTPRAWFVGEYGRIRSIVVAPNGRLWVTTSNRDGRGEPTSSDDRILEIAVD